MNIYFDNVTISSNSGPNSFARKLRLYLQMMGHTIVYTPPFDVQLSFIRRHMNFYQTQCKKLVLRLDGIYFNSMQKYEIMNKEIKEAAVSIAENEDVNAEWITPHRVGRTLSKLRLKKASRPGGKGSRRWKITFDDLERLTTAYGIKLTEALSINGTNGVNGTNGTNEDIKENALDTALREILEI